MALQRAACLTRNVVAQLFNRNICITSPMLIHSTPSLGAEPLKKKKRIDPAVIKAREERRKKKMEKQIRRLEKNVRQLKPIEEVEVPLVLIDEKHKRVRSFNLSPERLEEIALVKKEWSRYMLQQRLKDAQMFDRINSSQLRALNNLRKESEELYQAAVQIDEKLLPFSYTGPSDTPAIENYNSPDGDYTDISKKWV